MCDAAYGSVVSHEHGTTWVKDVNDHWKECSCGDKTEKAAHVDSNSDGKCDTCEYVITTSNDSDDEDDGGLGTGAIVIGSVAVVGVGGLSVFWFLIQKKTLAELLAIFKKS